MTNVKPESDARRVIVDLSIPVGHSVNAGVSENLCLGTPSITYFIKYRYYHSESQSPGKGSLLNKYQISRAFRHIKIDPGEYNLLGLKLDSYFIDSCLHFYFHYGSAISMYKRHCAPLYDQGGL